MGLRISYVFTSTCYILTLFFKFDAFCLTKIDLNDLKRFARKSIYFYPGGLSDMIPLESEFSLSCRDFECKHHSF